jgi:hypothetical protein
MMPVRTFKAEVGSGTGSSLSWRRQGILLSELREFCEKRSEAKREGLIVCGGDDMRGWEVVSRAGDQQERRNWSWEAQVTCGGGSC